MSIDPNELERTFAALLGQPAAEQTESLRILSVRDSGLACRVAALLDAHRDAPALDTLIAGGVAWQTWQASVGLVGRELGGWTLGRELGRGGMGLVHAGTRRRDGIEEHAAIKLLAIPMFDAAATSRFMREAMVLARLDHPGICRLRDWGHSAEGWPYLALDLIDGQPIDRHAGALSTAERIQLLALVAEAVGAAHRQLVVHLDLKPDNILIGRDGRPVLLDFGISRVLSDERGEATATLTRWLTPDYASPEQLRGEPASVAADIYALGGITYQVLTGQRPFDLAGLPVTDALRHIAHGAVAPSRIAAGLPRDMDAVIAKAMHPDASRRHVSADAFAQDLRAVLARRPVSARPDSVWYRLGKLVQRNPVAAPASALAMLAIAALAILLAVQAQDLREQRDRAERETARAQSATDFILGSLDAVDPKVLSGTGIGLVTLLDAAEQRLQRERGIDARLQSDLYTQTGRLRAALGENARALSAFDAGLAALEKAPAGPERDRRQVLLLGHRSGALRALGRVDEAIAAADQAMLMAQASDAETRVWARQRKVQALERQGDYDQAEAMTQGSLSLLPEGALATRAGLYNDLAAAGLSRLDYEFAERNARLAYETYEQVYQEPNLDQTEAAWRLAAALHNLGRMDEAHELLDFALTVRRQLYGDRDHRVAEVMSILAPLEQDLGRWQSGLDLALAAEAIYVETLDSNNPRLLSVFGASGNLLRDAGRLDESWQRFDNGLQLARRIYGEVDHPYTAFFLQALGSIEVLRGRHAEAVALNAGYIRMMTALGESSNVSNMYVHHNQSTALRGLGRFAEALEQAEVALDMGRRHLPDDDWQLGIVHGGYAHALLEFGRMADAETNARAAMALFEGHHDAIAPHYLLAHARMRIGVFTSLDSQADREQAEADLAQLQQLLLQRSVLPQGGEPG